MEKIPSNIVRRTPEFKNNPAGSHMMELPNFEAMLGRSASQYLYCLSNRRFVDMSDAVEIDIDDL